MLLQANLLMARGDYAAAAEVLERHVAKSEQLGAVRALQPRRRAESRTRRSVAARHGDARRRRPRAGGERGVPRAARQGQRRARLRRAGRRASPQAARSYLERVRLKSLQANKALLGFGWAADALKEPKLALVPWTRAAPGRDVGDAAVLEARIAVPYAYAELGAYGQSLERYKEAIAAFEQREQGARRVDRRASARGSCRRPDRRQPGRGDGLVLAISASCPTCRMPRHLTQVLAQHEFQEAFKNYRDLRFLAKNLRRAGRQARHLRRHAGNAPQGLRRQAAAGAGSAPATPSIELLAKRREALGRRDRRRRAGRADGVAFADAKERDLLARRDAAAERARARAGADRRGRRRCATACAASPARWPGSWRRSSPIASGTRRRRCARIDAELAEARRARRRRSPQAQTRRAGALRRASAQRIAALDAAARRHDPARRRADAASSRRPVQDIAVAELTRQQERLADYTTQARFAVAQLYDRATPAQGARACAAKP